MDFFNKLGNKITSGANVVANKTKDFAETTKIGIQISQDEGKVKDLYAELGKIYYKKFAANPGEEFLAAFNEIAAIQLRINEAKAQLQQIKGSKICEVCGAEIPANVAFCGSCGAKVVAPVNQASSEIASDVITVSITCPSCGKIEDSSVSFCSSCGCKLK